MSKTLSKKTSKKSTKKTFFSEDLFRSRLDYVAKVVESLTKISNADTACNEQLISVMLQDQTAKITNMVNNPLGDSEIELTPNEIRDQQLNSILMGTEEYNDRMNGSEMLPSTLKVPRNAQGISPTSDGLYDRETMKKYVDVKEFQVPDLLTELHSVLSKKKAVKKKVVKKKSGTKKPAKKKTKKRTTKKSPRSSTKKRTKGKS
tara:strand:- start:500 stop:1111 length:612 start_codon:yes stop_codon:yes gene_type:complete